jgi:hypothetical protein
MPWVEATSFPSEPIENCNLSLIVPQKRDEARSAHIKVTQIPPIGPHPAGSVQLVLVTRYLQ